MLGQTESLNRSVPTECFFSLRQADLWSLAALAALHRRLWVRLHLGWQETSWPGTFTLDTEGSLADLISRRCKRLNHMHTTVRGSGQPYITTSPGCPRPCIYPPLRHLSPCVALQPWQLTTPVLLARRRDPCLGEASPGAMRSPEPHLGFASLC